MSARRGPLILTADGESLMLLDRIFLWVACFLMALALSAFVWFSIRLFVIRRARRLDRGSLHRRGLCPTPRSLWWVDALLPYRLFFRHACGYDLSRQGALDATGAVRCPECGEVIQPRRLLMSPMRFRPGRMAFASLLLCMGCLGFMSDRGDGWIRYAPTYTLVGIQETGVAWQESSMRRELARRVNTGRESGWVSHRLAAFLVNDLRDDNVDWNAIDAVEQLGRMGTSALPALRGALTSSDAQQRKYAFVTLARIERAMDLSPPDGQTIAVAIESLRDDAYEAYVANAGAGFEYLYRHARETAEIQWAVVRALRTTDDPQQRLLCALLCGYCGFERGLRDAYPILIECLEDNDVAADARAAAPALAGFGPAVIPFLEATRRGSTDPQQRILIDLILFDLGAASAPAVRPDIRGTVSWMFGSPLRDINVSRLGGGGSIYWLDDYVYVQRKREAGAGQAQ